MRWGVSWFRGPGRGAALGVLAAAVVLRALDLGIVPEVRLRAFDIEERVWLRSSDPARVVIVDIDEKSLKEEGQWPWPRTLVAELVRRIAAGHPRVLGIVPNGTDFLRLKSRGSCPVCQHPFCKVLRSSRRAKPHSPRRCGRCRRS